MKKKYEKEENAKIATRDERGEPNYKTFILLVAFFFLFFLGVLIVVFWR